MTYTNYYYWYYLIMVKISTITISGINYYGK